MMPLKRKTVAMLAVLLVSMTGTVLVVCAPYAINQKRNRDRAREFVDSLHAGMSVYDAEKCALELGWEKNRIVYKPPIGLMRLSTDIDYCGMKNWIVYVDFRDEKIQKARVRTLDSIDEIPPGAPGDRYFDGGGPYHNTP